MRLDGPTIDALIAEIGDSISDCFQGRYLAILLLGSAARGEITFDTRDSILSDLDFLIVLPQTSIVTALLEMHRCRPRLLDLHSRLAQSPFRHVSIGLGHCVPRYWAVATPFMWELRETARVLHGSEAVKRWPVIRTAGDIPRWEGIRLIANRMCELIEILGASVTDVHIRERFLSYACVKAALACSEATLIDRGIYVATYEERSRRHARVADYFTDRQNSLIETAYRLKLGRETHVCPRDEPGAGETLHLVLSTLARLEITDPSHFAIRAKQEPRTAPGFEQDTLYWATQALRFRRVPLRRPITATYADAYRAAMDIVRGNSGDTPPAALCRRVADRYAVCHQTVSMVRM